MSGSDMEWPRLQSSLSSAQLAAREQFEGEDRHTAVLAEVLAEVERLRAQVDQQQKELTAATNASRWAEIRIDLLEQALRDAHAESIGTAEQLDICVEEIRSQDDRLSARLERMEDQVDVIEAVNAQLERDVVDLRVTRTEASENLEELAANLLVLTDKAQALALMAKENADLSVEEAERVAKNLMELSDVSEEIRSIADAAADRAEQNAERTEENAAEVARVSQDVVELTEVSNDILAIAGVANEAAEQGVVENQRIAKELLAVREVTEKTEARLREAMSAAGGPSEVETARLAEELEQLTEESEAIRSTAAAAMEKAERIDLLAVEVEELADESREARVLAEKAKDRADYAADSADATQVELEREAAAIREELSEVSGHESLEAIDAAIAELRSKLTAVSMPTPESAPKPAKRWQAYLNQPEVPGPRALEAAPTDRKTASSKKGKKSRRKD